MRAFDAHAIDRCRVPSIVLMENAGRQVVAAMEAMHSDLADRHEALRMCFPAGADDRPEVRVREPGGC